MGLAGAQKGTASIAETEVWHASWAGLAYGEKGQKFRGLGMEWGAV